MTDQLTAALRTLQAISSDPTLVPYLRRPPVQCTICMGSGTEGGSLFAPCTYCDGRGYLERPNQPTTRRSHMATTLTWAKARPMLHTLRQLTRSTNAAEGVSITFHGGYVGTVADGVMTLALDGAPIYTAPADWPISGHGTRKKEAAS